MERRLRIGRVAGVHGLAGTLKIESWCEPVEAILDYRPWFLRSAAREWRVELAQGRRHGRGLLVQLPGLDDPDQARIWVGASIEIPRSSLPPLPDGQYYWADLEGLEVRNLDGFRFGRVARVVPTGANDVLVVRGERERWIPFVLGRHVLRVDLEGGSITVDWDPAF